MIVTCRTDGRTFKDISDKIEKDHISDDGGMLKSPVNQNYVSYQIVHLLSIKHWKTNTLWHLLVVVGDSRWLLFIFLMLLLCCVVLSLAPSDCCKPKSLIYVHKWWKWFHQEQLQL
jgi:hypothetical protein